MSDEKSSSVGYRKPPQHTRFKPGQSGNPSGKRKVPASGPINIPEVLNGTVKVHQGTKAREMSVFEVTIRALVSRALKRNDFAAIKEFLELCEKYELLKPPVGVDRGGVLRVPNDWDWNEWMAVFAEHGAPPWPGLRSGLTEADEARQREQ